MKPRVANQFKRVHDDETARECYRERLEPNGNERLVRPQRERGAGQAHEQRDRRESDAGLRRLRVDEAHAGARGKQQHGRESEPEEDCDERVAEGIDAMGKYRTQLRFPSCDALFPPGTSDRWWPLRTHQRQRTYPLGEPLPVAARGRRPPERPNIVAEKHPSGKEGNVPIAERSHVDETGAQPVAESSSSEWWRAASNNPSQYAMTPERTPSTANAKSRSVLGA